MNWNALNPSVLFTINDTVTGTLSAVAVAGILQTMG